MVFEGAFKDGVDGIEEADVDEVVESMSIIESLCPITIFKYKYLVQYLIGHDLQLEIDGYCINK